MSDAHANADSAAHPPPAGPSEDHDVLAGMTATTVVLIAAGAIAVTAAPTPAAAAATTSATFLLTEGAIAMTPRLLAVAGRLHAAADRVRVERREHHLEGAAVCGATRSRGCPALPAGESAR